MATVSSPHTVTNSAPPMDSRDASSSLGELLRHAREDRGLTLETIANETKIPRRHLEALEHDDLAATPGPFYQRAEIRAYARVVGLDQDRALGRLEVALKAGDPGRAPVETPERQVPTTVRAYVPIALGVAIVAAALLGRGLWEDTPVPQDRGETSGAATPQRPPSDAVALVSARPESVALTGTPINAGVVSDAQVTTETRVPTGEADASAGAVTELVVTTQPAGARVTVNGIGWGTSPVTIRYLTPGDKRIRVSKEGYVAGEQVLLVSEGRRQALTIRLATAP
jgi:cytoskeleton protein RodZ